MTRAGSLAEAVDRVCAAETDSRSLRAALLDEVIGRVVPSDAHVWLLTDPVTTVGISPVADVPCLGELPGLIRRKYLSEVNRWTALAGVATAHLPVDADPATWAGFLRSYGIAHVASSAYADRYGTWGWLDLWRADERHAFDERERAALREMSPAVTRALRRALAATFREPAGEPAGEVGPLVMLLSPELEVQRATPATHDYLRTLVPPGPGRDPVPATAYNVAAQLLAREAGVDGHPPMARMPLATGSAGGGRWITARAGRLDDAATGRGRLIAVSLQEATGLERLEVFARATGLSDRETELLRHLAGGADTRQTGERMFLSEHTVQDHLKSVFAKTGTRSRRALLARALGR